jgi:hypothetical protein
MLHVFIFKIIDLLLLKENLLINISATNEIIALVRNRELHTLKHLDDMLNVVALFVEKRKLQKRRGTNSAFFQPFSASNVK